MKQKISIIVLLLSLVSVANICSIKAQSIRFQLTLQNEQNIPVEIHFSQGDLFEVQGENMQNIVMITDTTITLYARETRTIRLRGACFNEHYISPQPETEVNPTGLVWTPPQTAFTSQRAVWDQLNRRR